MAKQKFWKYQKPRQAFSYDQYVNFPLGKEITIKIKNWVFTKKAVEGVTKSVFTTSVIEVDGDKVEKSWTVYHYETLQKLKKKLGSKKGEIEIKATRHYDEDTMESYYDIA